MNTRPIYLVSVTPSSDADVIHLPLLGTRWLQPKTVLAHVDGIIFTSKTGVDAMERIDPSWKTLPVLCVGKATLQRVRELGGSPLETGSGYGEDLFEIIRTRYADKRWLYARPEVIASDFAQRLREAGISVEEAIVYETVCLAEDFSTPVADDAVLIFTSPSALKCFRSRYKILPGHDVVVIGKTTQKSLPDHPVHLASEPTVASCVTLAKILSENK